MRRVIGSCSIWCEVNIKQQQNNEILFIGVILLSWRYVCCSKLILYFYLASKLTCHFHIYLLLWFCSYFTILSLPSPLLPVSTLLLNEPVLFLLCMYEWMYVWMYVCAAVYTYVWIYVYICMHECMNAYMGWCVNRFCIGEVLYDIFLPESQYFT